MPVLANAAAGIVRTNDPSITERVQNILQRARAVDDSVFGVLIRTRRPSGDPGPAATAPPPPPPMPDHIVFCLEEITSRLESAEENLRSVHCSL